MELQPITWLEGNMTDIINEPGASTHNNEDVSLATIIVGCPKCQNAKIRITFKAGQEDKPIASFFCHPEYVANINRYLHTDIRNKRKRPDIEVVI